MALSKQKGGLRISYILNAIRFRILRPIAQPSVGTLSRFLFGNNAGFWNNLKPRLKNSSWFSSDLYPEHPAAIHLKTTGYFMIENICLEESLLDNIYCRFCSLIENATCSETRGERSNRDASRRLSNTQEQIPQVLQLINDELSIIIRSYFGQDFFVSRVESWRNYHVPITQGEVYSNRWHNDDFRIDRLKLFINLTDMVTKETGAFRLHDLQSSREIVRSGYMSRSWVFGKALSLLEDPERVIYAEGRRGSACLCNTQLCLHRAGVPVKHTYRDILEFTFLPC